MIKTSSTFSFNRLDYSKYHKKDFLNNEKNALYSLERMNPQSDNLILITNSKTETDKIDRNLLDKTKLLIHSNSGYDNFSVEFVKNADFPIIVGNPIRAHAVSNYILSCLYGHYSPLPRTNTWDDKRSFKRKLLQEENILIIGHGQIGSLIEKSLRPLVKNISIFDPFKSNTSQLISRETELFKMPIEDFDVIIPAASLNPTSYKIINKKIIKRFKDDYLLINAARGNLIDQEALLASLSVNKNSFAYLDVYFKEPCNLASSIWPKNCLRSSHIAGVFENLDESIINFEYELLKKYLLSPREALFEYKNFNLFNRLENNFLM